ncbi:MAG: hypothetical protein WKF30_08960 [Pyrinomonadaceae bacterium]
MLERIIGEDLRRGDFAEARKRLARVEDILAQQVLKVQDTAPLQLLSARLADAIGDTRKTDLYIGRILAAEWLLRGEIKFAIDRFCVRLALNRGETADARYLVDRIERMVTLISASRGSQHEEIIDKQDDQVSAATWMLSAEVALQEGAPKRADFDLERAEDKFAVYPPSPDDVALFDLLAGLARMHQEDPEGAAALGSLYRTHVGRTALTAAAAPLEAQTVARIAAACGRIDQAAAIGDLEAERWSNLGAINGALVDNYINDSAQLDEFDELPETALLIELLEETLTPFHQERSVDAELLFAAEESTLLAEMSGAAARDSAAEASAFGEASDLPLEFSLEHTRLDSVTSMLDLDRDTGVLEVDWRRCAPELIAEAITSGAISEVAARVSRAVIFFNDGAYVDAHFVQREGDDADDALLLLAPADIIFELFRIAMARIPGSRARQIIDDANALHIPERINLRPNHLNLEMSARLDDLRGRASPDEASLNHEALEMGWNIESPAQTEKRPRNPTSKPAPRISSPLLPGSLQLCSLLCPPSSPPPPSPKFAKPHTKLSINSKSPTRC